MNEWTTAPGSEDELKSIKDYLAVVRRRKWYLILPAVAVLAVSAAIALKIPPVYRSTGKVLIEQQEIPREWVPATVTSFADQRIQAISQRVLTTANLTRVIEKLDLFVEERREQSIDVLVQRMRDSFNVEMVSAKVRNPQTGRAGVATIAFTISFDHRYPETAQRIANELVSLYLEENARTRTEAVADTTRFLEEEADKLAAELSQMEDRIAEFKQQNMGQLPEQQDLNLQLLQRAEQALMETRRQIQSMEERKVFLESALVQMRQRPARTETGNSSEPANDLQSLRARYASLSGIYADDHPDLVRLRRRINSLEEINGAGGGTAAIEAKLRALRGELSTLEERYAGDHPDVRRVRDEIAALERRRDQTSDAGSADAGDDPVIVKARADLDTIEREIETLREQARKHAERVEEIERRISETPRAEQQYRQLVRDHENLQAKYRDIRAKQSSARVAEALEEDRKGERFTLIEPPQLPREPVKPDRLKIFMLGFAGAFVGGFGAVFARESIDASVRSSRTVSAATGVPVLGAIPAIETESDRRRTRRVRLLALLAVILVIAGAAALLHFYYKPLDLLWYAVLRRLETM